MGDITQLLAQLEVGGSGAVNRLLPVVYEELHQLVRRERWRDAAQTGTTSIVHEAYLKLAAQQQIDWHSRAQFFFLAAQVIRSILVDNARRASAQKRGGDAQHVELDPELLSTTHDQDLLALDSALNKLRAMDERSHAVVMCRFFGGMDVPEIAAALDCSPATIKRDWQLARNWLYRELRDEPNAPEAGA